MRGVEVFWGRGTELWKARGRLLEEIRRGPEAAYIALRDAPPELQGDKAVVLAAVKENALALEFASEVVKEDKDFVLAAVKENGAVLKFACLRAWRSTSACRGSSSARGPTFLILQACPA